MKTKEGRYAKGQSDQNRRLRQDIDVKGIPRREDGIYPESAIHGKIYPITEQKEETNETIEQRN